VETNLRYILFILILLALNAVAEPSTKSVTFRTWPAEVQVFSLGSDGAQYLGLSSSPVTLQYEERLTLEFRKTGFESVTTQFSPKHFESRDAWPEKGLISLKPANIGAALNVYAQEYPVVFGAAVLLLGGLGAWGIRSRRLAKSAVARADRLEELKAAADAKRRDGSMVMEVLGGYRLVDILGEGGMAIVYRALPEETLEDSQAVAIKVLSHKLSEDPDFSDRFRREVQVCTSLNHPNIIRVIDWGNLHGRLFLVLELVDGQTLEDAMPKDGFPLDQAKSILSQIFSGANYAHTHDIIHRDLKPENIMLTNKQRIKIMDFGLAKARQLDSLTKTGALMGTPAYMSPEQIQVQELDSRSDQYALGIIAYEVLTGKAPYKAETFPEMIFQHLNETASPVSEHRPELSKEVDEVIARMMAKLPDERFESTRAAAEALDIALCSLL
jgi:tRNA A-37 threonylcarbamoyl transferase component Bud32